MLLDHFFFPHRKMKSITHRIKNPPPFRLKWTFGDKLIQTSTQIRIISLVPQGFVQLSLKHNERHRMQNVSVQPPPEFGCLSSWKEKKPKQSKKKKNKTSKQKHLLTIVTVEHKITMLISLRNLSQWVHSFFFQD